MEKQLQLGLVRNDYVSGYFEVTAINENDKPIIQLVIHWPKEAKNIPALAIKFREPENLKLLIEELMKYRRAIWPDSDKVICEDKE